MCMLELEGLCICVDEETCTEEARPNGRAAKVCSSVGFLYLFLGVILIFFFPAYL